MALQYVLQVFYDRHCESRFPERDDEEHNGLRLWKPNKSPVIHWAIDYVSCSDARWIVYGPYNTLEQARADWFKLEGRLGQEPEMALRGYRLINEHCFDAQEPRDYDYVIYTDG